MKTPAELNDWLTDQGANRFVDTYLRLMKFAAQGGRTPGLKIPDKQELLDIYHKTTEQYWETLIQAAPEEAQAQRDQYAQLEGA